ncbi:hypothetical protein [Corticicoccus populi]|uniref:Type II toxin-antitoxin system Phd/YefM family antitoxin n=1 Tax=Corticicoccus populi TaxID=1812821 RepID=A0ABW5WW60_9STAP
MKILDVPYTSLSDMKKSPANAFVKARESKTGVYVFKNSKPYGVVMTSEQYEELNLEIESLYDKIDELIVKERIAETNIKVYSEEEVLGDVLNNVEYDDNDGWE